MKRGSASDYTNENPAQAALERGTQLVANCSYLLVAEGGLGYFLRGSRLDAADASERNEGTFDLRRLLAEHVLLVERQHAGILGLFLDALVAGLELLLTRVFGDAKIVERVVGLGVHVLVNQFEGVACSSEAHLLVA